MKFMKNAGFGIYWRGFVFSLLISITFAMHANAATFTVINTNDSGAGSLRQAITDANANPDPNLIEFAIPPLDGSVKTINLTSPLPAITDKAALNGLSRNGASCDSPKVEINGTSAGASGDGFTVTADDVFIQGFVINRFLGDGIAFDSSLRNTIRCNRIGTDASGAADLGNGASGILLDTSHFNLIEHNTISGNTLSGIRGIIAQLNKIQANVIGLSSDGTTVLANASGGIVLVGGHSNAIGGSTPASRNIISGNAIGIFTPSGATAANGNSIQRNLIGTALNGTSALPNFVDGIRLASSNNSIANNTIAFNAQKAVNILTTGAGNRISANSIFSNGNLGIDLGNDGVTPNDTGDGDLANNLQNYPVLSTANATTVQGTLNSTANTSFTLEFFLSPTADLTNFGEGQTYLGALNVTSNGSGNAAFTFTSPVNLPNGQFIAATATNTASGDTSEFSQVHQILAPTAANVGIQGRVLSRTGRGIYKAIVTLVEPDGNVRTTLTNPFGHYRFRELPAGANYVLSVSHKTHEFNPSSFVINLNDEMTDLVIIGNPRESPPGATNDGSDNDPAKDN